MSDAIREAFELGKRFTAASNALDVVIMDQIERAFAALQSQTAPAVPDGWKLVPVEPTVEMREAFHDANEEWEAGGLNSPDHQYRAMLAATPQPDHIGDANKMGGDASSHEVRPPKHHTLKTDPAVFDRSAMGRKPWEIRLDDRNFQVGDTVTLQETVFSGAQMREGAALEFTGKELTGQITYVLRGPKYGLADGWCVFSVEPDHSPDAGKVVQPDPVPYDNHERECGKLIDERDHAQDWADKLAGAIGEHFGIDIGEHSNCNCPWETAFDNMPDAPAADGGEVEVNRVADAILHAWKKAEPDHSITKNPISYIATFADMARAAIAAIHPAQPRNDQVAALEAFARDCGLFDSAYDDQEHIEIPRWRFKEYIARLRATQQEGE